MWSQSPSECTSEYEATGIQQDDNDVWKDELCSATSHTSQSSNQTSTSTSLQTSVKSISPATETRWCVSTQRTSTSTSTSTAHETSVKPNATETTRWVSTQHVSTALLSPVHITYHRASLPIISYPTPSPEPIPASSPSPCSPIHRPTRSTSAPSPTRFTFTSSHIASSQRRTLIASLRHPTHEMSWYGDVTRYPTLPIQLKLEKRWSASTPTLMPPTETSTSTVISTSTSKALPPPPSPAIPSIELILTPISISAPTTVAIPSAPSLSSSPSACHHVTSTTSPRDKITPNDQHWQLSPSSSSSPSSHVPRCPSVSIRIPSTPTSSSTSSSSSISRCLNMWHAHSLHATPLHVHHQRSTSIVSSH